MLLTLVACNNSPKKDNKEQKQETPVALQEEKSFNVISKREDADIMESLYNELADKTPDLKELESNLNSLSAGKSDSIKYFSRYNEKNESYYNSADGHLKQISDTILRKKLKSLIASSLAMYNAKISRHSELLKSIDKKGITLNDLHEILIISKTLPLIEKYQNDNLPSTKSITGFSKQLDRLIQTENSLLEKNKK